MKTITLRPVRHEVPVCASYEDPVSVVEFERAVRVQRAHAEPWTIVPPESRVDGTFQVRGKSGTTYFVDVVDGSGRLDTCDCPDFAANGLGTCKHREAVSRAIQSVRALGRAHARLPPECRDPVLTLDAEDQAVLRRAGHWRKAHLLALGVTGDDRDWLPPPTLRPGRHPSGVRVTHAAAAAARRMHARRQTTQRAQRFRDLAASGRLGVDLLNKPLFPYQRDGVIHLAASGRALLADDMGLGKTVQAIAACQLLRLRGEAERIVVVTPASLKHQWAREIETYTGERAVVVGGGPRVRHAALASSAPYKILNYELTWRELSSLKALDADVLVLDEAQRAKNFRTKTATTLREIPSRFAFVLTGTPVENRLDDLYALMQVIDPEVLGPLWRFNLDFHQQSAKGRVVGYKNLGGLRARLSPVVMRRRKEEVLSQLPPLTHQTRYTPLTEEQAELEAGYRQDASALLAKAERRPLSPQEQELLMKCLLKARQACDALELCDPSRGPASPKLDELEALIAEVVDQGTSKVLVFSEWVEMLKLAAARLDKLGVGWAMLSGEVPTERRGALLERFRQDPDQRVLLSSDAGGVGLNLQVATYVVHLDLPWNPARLDQRTSRAHRLGQTRGVSVTYLCSETGIERGIEGTLSGKRAVRDAALDQGSDVETLAAPSFTMFLHQLQEVMENLAEPGEDVEVTTTPEPEPAPEPEPEPAPGPPDPATAAPLPVVEVPPPAAPAPPTVADSMTAPPLPAEAAPRPPPPTPAGRPAGRADNRLHLARVVLSAGFPSDAVRASYEALAARIRELCPAPVGEGHAALVGAIYRDLLPSGRLPAGAHAALARLHDLCSLEGQGVEVPPSLAQETLEEAESWVGRLAQA